MALSILLRPLKDNCKMADPGAEVRGERAPVKYLATSAENMNNTIHSRRTANEAIYCIPIPCVQEYVMPGKVELLRGVPLFDDLSEQDLSILARYCRFASHETGEVIFSEGSHGEELFIIEEGEVLITKHRGESDVDIARFISGESFGELELLDEAPRSTRAIAEKPTTLLQFPREDLQFRDLLQRHAPLFAPVLNRLLVMIAERIRSTNRLISENAPWVQDLRRQLCTDKLTGLFNRVYLEEDFAELLPRHGEGTALLMVKPDRFKEINDRYGHEAGDRVLKAMAEAFRSVIGSKGVVARYRGDEFAVILPGAGSERARARSRDIVSGLSNIDVEALAGPGARPVTVSIGIALYPLDGTSNMDLIQKGFELMFAARNGGGNCTLCTDERLEVE
jgi:diguanylate cyclase (GGDEF)-like protein